MTQTLRVRSIVAAVLAPLVIAIGALVLVANQDPPLQKLSVGGKAGAQEGSADDARSDSGYGTSAPMMGMPYGGANYVLEGELPDLAGKAPAYRYVREDGAAAAAEVAEALGLEGEPQQRDSSWEVRDGSRTLVVNDFPGLPWFLSECFMPEDAVADTDEARPEFSGCAVKAEPVPMPMPHAAQVVLEGLPDRQSAEAKARSTLDRLGVASDDLHLDDGISSWYAWAPMRIGGFEVQMSTSVVIGVDGAIIGGNGMAGEPVHQGDYPLVSVQAGFARLRQGHLVGQFGMAGMARDLPAIGTSVVPTPSIATTAPPPSGGAVPPGCVPPPVCPPPSDHAAGITKEEFGCRELASGQTDGPSLDVCYPAPPYDPPPPYEPPVIKVTGARIVLVQVDDTLVPAYVFEVAQEFGGLTPPVPAVIDDLLKDFTAPVPPPETPRPLNPEPPE